VPGSPGPALFTVTGAVARPGVFELAQGSPVEALLQLAGGSGLGSGGLLTGGYFGRWVAPSALPNLTLDDEGLGSAGGRLGCGAVYVLPAGSCGVAAAASVLEYLAREGAQQCGPCRNGVPALAEVVRKVAAGSALLADHVSLERWSEQLASGRGACRLPDGAVAMLRSAVRAFAHDFAEHRRNRHCGSAVAAGLPAA
jgi:NADH:ubiquinone oxidoreductase subunit F (NADH-binding)